MRLFHNLSVITRRAVLALVMLIPQRFRTWLAGSDLLTRIYLAFDEAKYDQVHDRQSWVEALESGRARRRRHSVRYDYAEPAFGPDVKECLIRLRRKPLISVLLPVYNTKVEWLDKAIQSVQRQWYTHWEICLVDDCSDDFRTCAYVDAISDPRIKVHRLQSNSNIAGASNAALEMAAGEYVALLDHDDELTIDALYEIARAIDVHDADFVYSDEDKLTVDGRFVEPHFKADFSPDLFLSQNYLSHLGVIRRTLLDDVGGFEPGTDGAQDYDIYLKVLEHTNRIVHVPRVLYHWRKVPGSTAALFSEKSYAQEAGLRALSQAIVRRGLRANATLGPCPGTYRIRYAILEKPLVSIIIPFKDKARLTRTCIESILEKSTWRNFEIVGVSNNSEEPATYEVMKRLAAMDDRVRFVRYDVPFNFSAINNFAVREQARGEQVVLLNNDIEIINPDWLECLLEFSQRRDVGVVGACLYYPDGTLQHAGIIIGIGGVAGHSHKHLPAKQPGYFCRPHLVQNLGAVTAACCMVKRSLYEQVGGMDEEHLQVAFNDVDFCLRVREAGYLNVYTPYCEAWHHESVSRGHESTREKQARFSREMKYIRARHAEALRQGDPYYNPNLTLDLDDFSLRHFR